MSGPNINKVFKTALVNGYVKGKLDEDLTNLIQAGEMLEYNMKNGKPIFQTRTKIDSDTRQTSFSESDIPLKFKPMISALLNQAYSSLGLNESRPVEKAYLNILTSQPGRPTQQAHTDFNPTKIREKFYIYDTHTNSYIPDEARIEKIPFFAILALEDETEFCVVKYSHTKMLNDYYLEGDTNAFTVLKLQKGEYVIVHPCTVHFGAPYNRVNTRLHWYMDSMLFSRPKNSTNLLDNINFVSNTQLCD
jgi:hypothetical protein